VPPIELSDARPRGLSVGRRHPSETLQGPWIASPPIPPQRRLHCYQGRLARRRPARSASLRDHPRGARCNADLASPARHRSRPVGDRDRSRDPCSIVSPRGPCARRPSTPSRRGEVPTQRSGCAGGGSACGIAGAAVPTTTTMPLIANRPLDGSRRRFIGTRAAMPRCRRGSCRVRARIRRLGRRCVRWAGRG
jgi:hypothetical protein